MRFDKFIATIRFYTSVSITKTGKYYLQLIAFNNLQHENEICTMDIAVAHCQNIVVTTTSCTIVGGIAAMTFH